MRQRDKDDAIDALARASQAIVRGRLFEVTCALQGVMEAMGLQDLNAHENSLKASRRATADKRTD